MQNRVHTTSRTDSAELTFPARGGGLPDTLVRPQFRFAWQFQLAWKDGVPPVIVAEPAAAPVRPGLVPRLLAALAARLSTIRRRA